MSVRTELRRAVLDSRRVVDDTRKVLADTRRVVSQAKPLYAAAGAGDLWIAKLRAAGSRVQSTRLEPAGLQQRVTASVDGLQGGVVAVQQSVQAQLTALPGAAAGAATRLVDAYDDLAQRGEKTVGRIRRQQATQDFAAQAKTTVSKAKATRTTARKSASATASKATSTTAAARKGVKRTATQAKGATTSARKTAAAGRKAAAAASAKVG